MDSTSWGSYSYAFGPVMAIGAMIALILLLRWAFDGRPRSLVQRRPGVGEVDEYGLLTPVARPATFIEAEMLRRRLLDAGLRATVAPARSGPAVMVFAADLEAARRTLDQAGP